MREQAGYQEIYALTLQALAKLPEGQYEGLLGEVANAAVRADLVDGTYARENRAEYVRQALHSCYVRGLLVFGTNKHNPEWPFYRLTEHGRQAVASQPPQPYDPDGFLRHFDNCCSGVDPDVRAYVVEAVQTFNRDCLRASAVMLGCASEKLILLLCEAFEAAISDASKKTKFENEMKTLQISAKYAALRKRLELMVTSKELPHSHRETVAAELPAGFELLRRCRNSGGHPNVPGDVSAETIFMNLRMFTEYTRQVGALIQYFKSNPADW